MWIITFIFVVEPLAEEERTPLGEVNRHCSLESVQGGNNRDQTPRSISAVPNGRQTAWKDSCNIGDQQ